MSERVLLVGDNPFHGISHLSQERAMERDRQSTVPEYAADLVLIGVENGADGFMFSVSETTLSILKEIRRRGEVGGLGLYAIVPYAYEYVRLANRVGGLPGLAKKLSKEMFLSGNLGSMARGLRGVLGGNLVSLLESYLGYELSKIRSAVGRQGDLCSVLLHEVVTDLALALGLDWVFESFVDFWLKRDVTPGFNTGNFAVLVKQLRDWDIDLSKLLIAAPFNKVGFQMNPSREECEEELMGFSEPVLLAISILAAGYLSPLDAVSYVATLRNVKGVAVGVSKEVHARETFRLLRERLG